MTEFFGHICKNLKPKDEAENESNKYTVSPKIPFIPASKSAIKYEFKRCSVPFPEETDLLTSDLLRGYMREVAKFNKDKVLSACNCKRNHGLFSADDAYLLFDTSYGNFYITLM